MGHAELVLEGGKGSPLTDSQPRQFSFCGDSLRCPISELHANLGVAGIEYCSVARRDMRALGDLLVILGCLSLLLPCAPLVCSTLLLNGPMSMAQAARYGHMAYPEQPGNRPCALPLS